MPRTGRPSATPASAAQSPAAAGQGRRDRRPSNQPAAIPTVAPMHVAMAVAPSAIEKDSLPAKARRANTSRKRRSVPRRNRALGPTGIPSDDTPWTKSLASGS